MDSSMSRAGLVSGMAKVIFGTVPASVADDDMAGHASRRALRLQVFRETMQSLSQRETRRTMTYRTMRRALEE